MTRIGRQVNLGALTLALVACGNGAVDESTTVEEAAVGTTTPEVTFEPGEGGTTTTKPGAPVTIGYKIIGTPIVGQPVAVDLRFSSALDPQTITVSYRVNDPTSLEIPASQPRTLQLAMLSDREFSAQQVSVVPLREGRVYLNVSAAIETEDGSLASVTAIPIQVGAPVETPAQRGEPGVDDSGEAIIKLPVEED